jgi:hypothetical protein
LQALTTLNEVVFIECAQALAKSTVHSGGATDAERLTYAFRRCVSRTPDAKELGELQNLLTVSKRRLSEGWTSSVELATGKLEMVADLPEGLTPTDLAAYTLVARVLLNLDETITKE